MAGSLLLSVVADRVERMNSRNNSAPADLYSGIWDILAQHVITCGRLGAAGGSSNPSPGRAICGIVPPEILRRIAEGAGPDHPDVPDDAAAAAQRTLEADALLRRQREVFAERGRGDLRGPIPGLPNLRVGERVAEAERRARAKAEPVVQRAVYDAQHQSKLPGRLVRGEGKPPTTDDPVNRAYDGLGATWQLYWSAFQRNSLDAKGLELVASVHYEEQYDNAFWDGQQMVFGDGDGTYFNDFTSSVDVIGHELAHGVTQYTAGLTYVTQSGALNESVSDCFGSMVKQQVLGQDAADADWLIGEGLFTAKVQGVALRSMKAPGTAYDDPVLGKDPQPADMDGYVKLPADAQHDNGGVHTNSGIPNRAFYLAAASIGGRSWEGAGLVWYDVLTGSSITKDIDFAGFARLTVDAAEARFGAGSSQARAVKDAWQTVKVLKATAKKTTKKTTSQRR
jgi:Thermolysin metallopeptidase, alpha-helical domain/Thermolysin metallopeptidase, catalytic domain